MKSAEKEALLKSFALYFLSLFSLITLLLYFEYDKEMRNMQKDIYEHMRFCSYELDCSEYSYDFIEKSLTKTGGLFRENGDFYADFEVPGSDNYLLRIRLVERNYRERYLDIVTPLLIKYIILLILASALALLFALYSLKPLRRALRLTEEFAADILHDFNTPLSVIRLNSSLLAAKIQESKELKRIEKGVESILQLQQDLREELERREKEQERFDLLSFLRERTELLSSSYPSIEFSYAVEPLTLMCERRAFQRVLDNILENAAKYSGAGGVVEIFLERDEKRLHIVNRGREIENPDKIFSRFYREAFDMVGRGMGMNIVRKLSSRLNIAVSISSDKSGRTEVLVDISEIVTQNKSSR